MRLNLEVDVLNQSFYQNKRHESRYDRVLYNIVRIVKTGASHSDPDEGFAVVVFCTKPSVMKLCRLENLYTFSSLIYILRQAGVGRPKNGICPKLFTFNSAVVLSIMLPFDFTPFRIYIPIRIILQFIGLIGLDFGVVRLRI